MGETTRTEAELLARLVAVEGSLSAEKERVGRFGREAVAEAEKRH